MVFMNKKEKGFISLSSYNHNKNIERVVYGNSKITKPLFWVGAVLPDFKICWGILLVYLVYTYPISFKTRVIMKLREFRSYIYLLKRRYI